MTGPFPADVVVSVDRLGGRGTVIVTDEHEREVTLPAAWFPRKPAEGDVFVLRLQPDDTRRDRRRAEVAALSNRLDQRTGPDDTEVL